MVWAQGHVTWAKMAKNLHHLWHHSQKMETKTKKFFQCKLEDSPVFFSADSKTSQVFWGFEQLSHTIDWRFKELLRHAENWEFCPKLPAAKVFRTSLTLLWKNNHQNYSEVLLHMKHNNLKWMKIYLKLGADDWSFAFHWKLCCVRRKFLRVWFYSQMCVSNCSIWLMLS